jgi:hypothetical protein
MCLAQVVLEPGMVPPAAVFDKTPTPPIIAFEVGVVAAAIGTLVVLSRFTPRIKLHFIAICVGVLVFQVFTAPMWDNHHLGPWAYVYADVSWVLTLGWATMILVVVFLIDRLFGHLKEWRRFLLYLMLLTPVTLVAERLVVLLGIRGYAPEVLARTADWSITVLDVPVAALYYVPVFMTLTISFYKYWVPVIEGTRVPEVQGRLWRRLLLAFIGVFLFEIMVEPMINNHNFPRWSYVFYDISILLTAIWVVILAVCTYVVDRLLAGVDLRLRFAAYLVLIDAIALPLEAWLIRNGFREYGPSATANFSGFRTVLGDIPLEVAFGIPLYLALVIAFVRYWERIGGYESVFDENEPAVQPEGRTLQPEAS